MVWHREGGGVSGLDGGGVYEERGWWWCGTGRGAVAQGDGGVCGGGTGRGAVGG